MDATDIMQRNRVILAHFDGYSAALLFVRWNDSTMLWPRALRDLCSAMPAPDEADALYDGAAVRQAMIERCGFNPDDIVHVGEFEQWAQTSDGLVRIHLLRFTTPEAPKVLVEAHNSSFKHMTQLRGAAMNELLLLREVFNLTVGGGAR